MPLLTEEPWTDQQLAEKYSSAITLSDMEIFIFPELYYALVLGNLLSPRIWQWRDDPWFAGVRNLNFNRQLQRLKQYIMEHYNFNLDLETWGLTTKAQERARFIAFVDEDFFARSNALFGYEGDKYYYNQDIRKHFGLEKYTTDTIPYWKTETVEAMDAFRFKPGHQQGAGECVSLSALYAAALHAVLGIPLEDIYLLATPLHSQNFILQGEGVLTNNRRLVTKTMWFNGTELSTKARRALEKERVTIVSHLSGYIHIEYPDATIASDAYHRFSKTLGEFLRTPITFEIFSNFLRVHEQFRRYFEFEYENEGRTLYIDADILYKYEHNSKFSVGDRSRKKLMTEVETEEFRRQRDPEKCQLNMIEEKLNGQTLYCCSLNDREQFRALLGNLSAAEEMCQALWQFTCVKPQLPSADKHYQTPALLALPSGLSPAELSAYLQSQREHHPTVDLAFYVNRQIDRRGWQPFLKACLERNPVSRERFQGLELAEVYQRLLAYPAVSIYDEDRLATPDEVVNFQRGDGLEKALVLLNICQARGMAARLQAEHNPATVAVITPEQTFRFNRKKLYPPTEGKV